MSIFDIEEQPITEKGLLELGFRARFLAGHFMGSYANIYYVKEDNIKITYSVAIKPQGDSWVAHINISYFSFRMTCTSIRHAYGVFVSNNATIWSSLDMHEDWEVPPLVVEVKTLNDLIILTSSNNIKQYCKEFITSDKILW